MPGRIRYLLPRLLLSISVFVGSIAILEVSFRCAGFEPNNRRDTAHRGARALIDDERSFRFHPERIYELSEHYRHSEMHHGRYARGAWPFRGRPPQPVAPATKRIAVLGDSCVYGTNIDVADTLPERIQFALSQRWKDEARAQVLNFGVPGYTTVQMRVLLEEVLETVTPQVVVLYAAAWNDQTPSLGASDRQLQEGHVSRNWIAKGLEHTATYAALRSWLHPAPRAKMHEAMESLKRDGAPLAPRVSVDEVEQQLRAMVHACRAAGVSLVMVVPAHPPETLRRHPRTATDAALVRRVAIEESVTLVDAPAIFAGASDGGANCFTDFVHFSPAGTELLARSITNELMHETRSGSSRAVDRSLHIRTFEPSSSSAFGDIEVTLELSGWSAAEELPVVLVGGAPLQDLRLVSEHRVRGTLIANSAGRHRVTIQSAHGQAVAQKKMRLDAPKLVTSESMPTRVLLCSREGDRAIIFVSSESHERVYWSSRGAQRLHPHARRALAEILFSGSEGIELPASLVTQGTRLYLQPLVIPRGEPEYSRMARYGDLLTLEF